MLLNSFLNDFIQGGLPHANSFLFLFFAKFMLTLHILLGPIPDASSLCWPFAFLLLCSAHSAAIMLFCIVSYIFKFQLSNQAESNEVKIMYCLFHSSRSFHPPWPLKALAVFILSSFNNLSLWLPDSPDNTFLSHILACLPFCSP